MVTTPPGRAVTDEQKRAVVERLLAAWMRMPHLRLGQFVCACSARTNADPFFIEDETLVTQAVEFAGVEEKR
jgi:hypothetical protein